MMVDWQRDFLDATGFGAALGNDVTPLRRALGPAARVLAAARASRHDAASERGPRLCLYGKGTRPRPYPKYTIC